MSNRLTWIKVEARIIGLCVLAGYTFKRLKGLRAGAGSKQPRRPRV